MSASGAVKPAEYLIVINGLPKSYTWQDLKDFVRLAAEHEFWADTGASSNGIAPEQGWIRTRRYKEVCNLYIHLQKETLNGRKLTPVLWDTSRSPPKQLAPDPTRSASKTSTHPAVANSNLSSASTSHPPQGGQTSLAQSIAGLSIQQRQQQEAIYYAQQQKQQQQEQQQQAICLAQQQQQQRQPPTTAQQYKIGYTAPAVQQSQTAYSPQSHASAARQAIPSRYVTSGTKQPVNVSNGFAVTVSRGIFVSGLNYKVKESDVKHLFSKIGNVVESRLLCDPSTGKSKGVATVLFSTAKEAQEAIFRYHGALWMEKKIKVRPDTEATTVVEPRREDDTPLIVNGSRRY